MHQTQHTKNSSSQHTSVLLEEVVLCLDPQVGDTYLDLTAGYGGHASEIFTRTKSPQSATLVDRDENAVDVLREKFGSNNTEIIHKDFLSASKQLLDESRTYDCILADLGVSSPHLNMASRGFSFRHDGPLDMRMDQRQTLTAHTIVNSYDASDLAEILKNYGEEPKAKRIAQAIIDNRPVNSTSELAAIVKTIWPGHSSSHPATRTFQALRIAVNRELDQLKQSIPLWLELLSPGGRLAIISFHSLEDRIVKQSLAKDAGNRYDAQLRLLTKRPLTASQHEIVLNPRARSAKLRAAVKIKTNIESQDFMKRKGR
jgi:16S rRNA (cytosine1402-N4)-methyltransferase